MTLKTIDPKSARRLLEDGAVLIDVRDRDEHARESIPGARSLPLTALGEAPRFEPGQTVVFHCRSGARTAANAGRLAALGEDCEAYLLEGGIDAWKEAGLPIRLDRREPLPLMRQVQIVAGSVVVLGVVLGFAVSPWFFGLSGLVGAGLAQAGITGWCGMANVLRAMPWNRRAAAGRA